MVQNTAKYCVWEKIKICTYAFAYICTEKYLKTTAKLIKIVNYEGNNGGGAGVEARLLCEYVSRRLRSLNNVNA